MLNSVRSVVITGATRGIGKGLAREFIKRGHNVCFCGRSQKSVDNAYADLVRDAEENGTKVIGHTCDVSNIKDVQNLWDKAKGVCGQVDIWINNAGVATVPLMAKIADLDPTDITAVPQTNLIGSINGCHVALNGMTEQGHGAIYNFEGFGSNGEKNWGLAVYGSSKYALTYFTQCLVKETKASPVIVGCMSPGIVTTDMILGERNRMTPEQWAKTRRIYAILADDVQTVTPYLVDGVLNNQKHGARIAWLTKSKVIRRFLASRFLKRKLPRGL